MELGGNWGGKGYADGAGSIGHVAVVVFPQRAMGSH